MVFKVCIVGANQQTDETSGGAEGGGHVSHQAILTHTERASQIKEFLESKRISSSKAKY